MAEHELAFQRAAEQLLCVEPVSWSGGGGGGVRRSRQARGAQGEVSRARARGGAARHHELVEVDEERPDRALVARAARGGAGGHLERLAEAHEDSAADVHVPPDAVEHVRLGEVRGRAAAARDEGRRERGRRRRGDWRERRAGRERRETGAHALARAVRRRGTCAATVSRHGGGRRDVRRGEASPWLRVCLVCRLQCNHPTRRPYLSIYAYTNVLGHSEVDLRMKGFRFLMEKQVPRVTPDCSCAHRTGTLKVPVAIIGPWSSAASSRRNTAYGGWFPLVHLLVRRDRSTSQAGNVTEIIKVTLSGLCSRLCDISASAGLRVAFGGWVGVSNQTASRGGFVGRLPPRGGRRDHLAQTQRGAARQ